MDLYAVKSRIFALIRWKGSTNNRHVRIVLMTVTGVHGYNQCDALGFIYMEVKLESYVDVRNQEFSI